MPQSLNFPYAFTDPATGERVVVDGLSNVPTAVKRRGEFEYLGPGVQMAYKFKGPRSGKERIVSSLKQVPKSVKAANAYEEIKPTQKRKAASSPKPKAAKPKRKTDGSFKRKPAKKAAVKKAVNPKASATKKPTQLRQPVQSSTPDASLKKRQFRYDLAQAFEKIDRRQGGTNFIKLHDMRKALSQYSREEFDSMLNDLRRSQLYSLDSSDGNYVRLNEEERAAGIREASSNLVYIQRYDRDRPDRPPKPDSPASEPAKKQPASPQPNKEIQDLYARAVSGELSLDDAVTQFKAAIQKANPKAKESAKPKRKATKKAAKPADSKHAGDFRKMLDRAGDVPLSQLKDQFKQFERLPKAELQSVYSSLGFKGSPTKAQLKKELWQRVEGVRDNAKRLGEKEPSERTKTPSPQRIESEVMDVFNEMLPNHGVTNRVPVHKVRDEIARRLGSKAASAQVFNDVVKRMRSQGKIGLLAISNTRDADIDQLNKSIPGIHETLFYIEKPLK